MKTQVVLIVWILLFFHNYIGNSYSVYGTKKVFQSQLKQIDDSNSVVDYYNYVNKSLGLQNYLNVLDFEFPKLLFINRWNGWVVKDTTINNPEAYSIIEDYIGESNYSIFYTNDYLKIENRQRLISEPRVVIETKLFKTTESYIIGISYSYISYSSFSDVGYKFFQIEKDSTVNDITSKIFNEPVLKEFFKNKGELRKFKKYSCLKLAVDFAQDDLEFEIEPIFTCENMCGDKSYNQMCTAFNRINKIRHTYKYAQADGQFVLLDKKVLPGH